MTDIFWTVLLDGAFAAVAAIGFAVISNPPRKAIPLLALLAAFGHGLRFFLMEHSQFGIATASLLAALAMGLVSIVLARRFRMPAEFFSFPALLPMIPGMYAYKTILALLRFMNTDDPALMNGLVIEIHKNGLATFFVMWALVIGALFPLLCFHKRSFLLRQYRRLAARGQGRD